MDSDLPMVRMCAFCQKEFPEVDVQVKEAHAKGTIKFSHGLCRRHFTKEMMKNGVPEDKVLAGLNRMKIPPPSDLKAEPDLVKLYSRGIFTKEAAVSMLRNRFQTLANVKTQQAAQ